MYFVPIVLPNSSYSLIEMLLFCYFAIAAIICMEYKKDFLYSVIDYDIKGFLIFIMIPILSGFVLPIIAIIELTKDVKGYLKNEKR